MEKRLSAGVQTSKDEDIVMEMEPELKQPDRAAAFTPTTACPTPPPAAYGNKYHYYYNTAATGTPSPRGVASATPEAQPAYPASVYNYPYTMPQWGAPAAMASGGPPWAPVGAEGGNPTTSPTFEDYASRQAALFNLASLGVTSDPVVTSEHLFLLAQLAERDQLIGRLKVEQEEMQRRFVEKEAEGERIQTQNALSQQDMRHLHLDLEFMQQKLEDYVKRSQELEDTNHRLFSELEYKEQELKHTAFDLEVSVGNGHVAAAAATRSGSPTGRPPSSLGTSNYYTAPLSGSIALALRTNPRGPPMM